MPGKTKLLLSLLAGQPVVPVLRIDRVEDAVPLARALVQGGLAAIEITMRTPVALDAIRAVAAAVPQCVVGAGTILDAAQFGQAVSAGARFIVSPGTTPSLLSAAAGSDIPLLPGAVTPAEIMLAREAGYELLKFFPAEQAGGAPFLSALAAPFAGISFCPTGGVSAKNARDYLALANVVCVGGSWVAPQAAVKAGDWAAVETLAREASALKG
jgi:2-dehydro-3-deoxyphosphogluconate aldolase/(4S)-4-hydroxy-2-oxoglutarate aldolase